MIEDIIILHCDLINVYSYKGNDLSDKEWKKLIKGYQLHSTTGTSAGTDLVFIKYKNTDEVIKTNLDKLGNYAYTTVTYTSDKKDTKSAFKDLVCKWM